VNVELKKIKQGSRLSGTRQGTRANDER